MRGNCGGAFPVETVGDLGGAVDDDGPYIEVSAIVSPIGEVAGDLIEHRCRSCPVACGLRLEPVFRLYSRSRPTALGPAAFEGRRLSAIAAEALVVLAIEHDAMSSLHHTEAVRKIGKK